MTLFLGRVLFLHKINCSGRSLLLTRMLPFARVVLPGRIADFGRTRFPERLIFPGCILLLNRMLLFGRMRIRGSVRFLGLFSVPTLATNHFIRISGGGSDLPSFVLNAAAEVVPSSTFIHKHGVGRIDSRSCGRPVR